MKYHVTIDGRTLEVDLTGSDPVIDGTPVRAQLVNLAGTAVRHLLVDNRSHVIIAQAGAGPGRWSLTLGSRSLEAEVVDDRTWAIREMSGSVEATEAKVIFAPMPGLVVRINVELGQPVEAGQGIVVVEAMKMENELKAPAAGRVTRIDVVPGQVVEKGATLVVFE